MCLVGAFTIILDHMYISMVMMLKFNQIYVSLTVTAGLAPSVKKMSFGLAGKPSRASIPAAIVSRNPFIP